jgi:ATP synthase protein I
MRDNGKVMADEEKPTGGGGGLHDLVKAESMIQLALAIPLGCLVGLGFGTLLDRHFHQHWMGVLGIFLGAAGGFIQIFTTAQRYLKRGD